MLIETDRSTDWEYFGGFGVGAPDWIKECRRGVEPRVISGFQFECLAAHSEVEASVTKLCHTRGENRFKEGRYRFNEGRHRVHCWP